MDNGCKMYLYAAFTSPNVNVIGTEYMKIECKPKIRKWKYWGVGQGGEKMLCK